MKLRKRVVLIGVIVLLICNAYLAAAEEAPLWLRLDAENGESVLPRSFRTLDELAISGSGQFAENNLQAIKTKLSGKSVTIVDLREESHGFVNGNAVSWYGVKNWANKGKLTEIIVADENNRLAELQTTGQAIVNTKVKKLKKNSSPEEIAQQQVVLSVETVMTETQLAARHGFGYYRITNTDHIRPLDSNVDVFVSFVNSLPADTWLHFHCMAGHGRTTTFMAMLDMLRNAKNTPISEIIQRQQQAGGIDLFSENETGSKAEYSAERAEFLRQFYEYCQQNNDGYITSWSAWLATQ